MQTSHDYLKYINTFKFIVETIKRVHHNITITIMTNGCISFVREKVKELINFFIVIHIIYIYL